MRQLYHSPDRRGYRHSWAFHPPNLRLASLPMIKFILILCLMAAIPLRAQETPAATETPVTPEQAVPSPVEDDDGVRVAVLGYHDFTLSGEATEMRILTEKFRAQMEQLRQLGIAVISMDDFTAWKRGTKTIPEKSVLLTFDDGWKSVYDDAFPILKEFNYPFTIFLYKNYVDGGGKALTSPMIREMVKAGAVIGSHSVSHPYPITFKKHRDEGADAYDRFLRKEMGESKRFIESKFKTKALTYSYPGGYVSAEMLPIAEEFGYQFAFTTKPGKTQRSTPDMTIPRYMILGNYDKIFEFATNFNSAIASPATANGATPALIPTLPYPVFPEPGAIIDSRLPEIHADLSKLENFKPESLVMKVSGFAQVPSTFNPETKKFSWVVNRRLRHPNCEVIVTWQDTEGKTTEIPLRWSFQIDREAAYLIEAE